MKLLFVELQQLIDKYSPEILVYVVTDTEEYNDTIANNLYEQEEKDKLLNIFYVTSEQWGRLYFFQDKDGMYHTVVGRESIYTDNLNEVLNFCKENK